MANSTFKNLQEAILQLRGKRVLLITTSNRWSGDTGLAPKSTRIAEIIQSELGETARILDVTKLNIVPCEGNVSSSKGNSCGLKDAILKDDEKNPTGFHRCWASLNNPDDELWKVSRAIFESDVVLFFVSTRWGQANGFYQKLIERLTWLENRHASLGEENVIGRIQAGGFFIGHNWNVEDVMKTQRSVLEYFGFQTPPQLFLHWQWTEQTSDETLKGYREDAKDFREEWEGESQLAESFAQWLGEAAYDAGSRKPTPEEIEMCKSPEGFNQINHCKALGLIPREDGTKAKSKKYGGNL